MRFVIILILGGLGVWGFRSCRSHVQESGGLSKTVTGAFFSGPEKSAGAGAQVSASAMAPTRTAEGEEVFPPISARPHAVPAVTEAPDSLTTSRIVKFRHVPPPAAEGLNGLAGLGVTILVERQASAVFVRGPADLVVTAAEFLEALDVPQAACAVQTWAVFVDRKAQRGFDLVAALSEAVGQPTTAILGGGAFTLDIGADAVAIALNIIADGSSVEVLQRPHVRLTHGVPARIESTQEVPIPTTSVSQGVSQTSIEFRKVGLQLQVTPFFLTHERIRLAVLQSNGVIGQTVKIEGNEIPVIQSQTVETTAELAVGETIVLGGVSTRRLRHAKGLLRNTTEVDEGALYVVLSTYAEVPRAIPVSTPRLESVDGFVPLSTPLLPSGEWIAGQLLPPLEVDSAGENK